MKKDLPYIEPDGRLRNTHHFCKAGQERLETGKYCHYRIGTPAYDKFWEEEERKCLYGVKIGDVRITGYHYFYLNYYPMQVPLDPYAEKSEVIDAHPRFTLLDWNFFNIIEYCETHGIHLGMVKVRRAGFSEKAASMGARDFALYEFDKYNRPIFRKDLYLAYDTKYLSSSVGILPKVYAAINFLNSNTQEAFLQNFLDNKEGDMWKRAGIESPDRKTKTQTGGEVAGILVSKPDNARGAVGYKMFWEESGANPELEKSFAVALGLAEKAGVTTGTHILWGTSNEDPRGVEGLKTMLYNPRANGLVRFRNVWEQANGEPADLSTIPYDAMDYLIPYDSDEPGVGWFVPVYEASLKFMDKDGNPLRKEAKAHYDRERAIKETGQGESTVLVYKADYPFTLQEALYKRGSNFFDQAKLSQQYVDVVTKKMYNLPGKNKPYEKGFLIHETNVHGQITNIIWKEDPNGDILIYEHPTIVNGQAIPKLYVMGIDSIDMGTDMQAESTTGSSFCAMIKKRTVPDKMLSATGNMYVAMYKDRPRDEREAFMNALKLSLYYNCKINLELTKKEIVSFFRDRGLYYKFMTRPTLTTTSMSKLERTKNIGTTATPQNNRLMDKLVANYIKDYCNLIMFDGLLKDLLEYTVEGRGRYDAVVAMGLTEVADQDMSDPREHEFQEQAQAMQLPMFFRDEEGFMHYGVPGNKSEEIPMPIHKTVDYLDHSKGNITIIYRDANVNV